MCPGICGNGQKNIADDGEKTAGGAEHVTDVRTAGFLHIFEGIRSYPRAFDGCNWINVQNNLRLFVCKSEKNTVKSASNPDKLNLKILQNPKLKILSGIR